MVPRRLGCRPVDRPFIIYTDLHGNTEYSLEILERLERECQGRFLMICYIANQQMSAIVEPVKHQANRLLIGNMIPDETIAVYIWLHQDRTYKCEP